MGADAKNRKTILRQIGALLVSGAVGRVAMLLANIVMIHALPVEQNGTLQVGLGIGILAAIGCELGSRGYLLRELSCLQGAPERAQQVLSQVMGLRYWASVVAVALLGILWGVFRPDSHVVLLMGLMVVYAWLDSLSMQWKAVLRAYDRVGLDATLTVAGRGLVLLALVGLHSAKQLNGLTAAVAFMCGAVVESYAAGVAIRMLTPLRPTRGSAVHEALGAARRTAAYGVANVCSTVNARQGTLLLGVFANERSAGYLATAQKLPEAAAFVPVAIMNAVIPHLARLADGARGDEQDQAAVARSAALRCGQLLSVCGAGAAVLASLLLFSPKELLRVLGWQAYEPAVTAFQLCGVWTILNSWNYVTANMLLSLRDDAWVRRRYASATATIFAVNLVAVPLYGFVGAGLALVAGEILQTGLDFFRLRRLGVAPRISSYLGGFGVFLLGGLGAGAASLLPVSGFYPWLGMGIVGAAAGLGAMALMVPLLRRGGR